jgi:hypothetical protein
MRMTRLGQRLSVYLFLGSLGMQAARLDLFIINHAYITTTHI